MKFGLLASVVILIWTIEIRQASSQTSEADSLDDNNILLNVISNIDGADALLDTLRVGVTPVTDASVPKGRYTLRLINSKKPGDWQNENLEIKLNLTKDTTVTANFPYYYYFSSSPSNAHVIKGDSTLGLTPLRYRSLAILKGAVVIRKNNYRDAYFDMGSYDALIGVNVKLKPKDNVNIPPEVYRNRGTQFKTSRSLAGILGCSVSTIAFGYSAFSFKQTANDYYDQYAVTGDKSKLEDSRTNDKYFAASLVLMQAAVAGLIYFIFFD